VRTRAIQRKLRDVEDLPAPLGSVALDADALDAASALTLTEALDHE
jgi:hypothetical protein